MWLYQTTTVPLLCDCIRQQLYPCYVIVSDKNCTFVMWLYQTTTVPLLCDCIRQQLYPCYVIVSDNSCTLVMWLYQTKITRCNDAICISYCGKVFVSDDWNTLKWQPFAFLNCGHMFVYIYWSKLTKMAAICFFIPLVSFSWLYLKSLFLH